MKTKEQIKSEKNHCSLMGIPPTELNMELAPVIGYKWTKKSKRAWKKKL